MEKIKAEVFKSTIDKGGFDFAHENNVHESMTLMYTATNFSAAKDKFDHYMQNKSSETKLSKG